MAKRRLKTDLWRVWVSVKGANGLITKEQLEEIIIIPRLFTNNAKRSMYVRDWYKQWRGYDVAVLQIAREA